MKKKEAIKRKGVYMTDKEYSYIRQKNAAITAKIETDVINYLRTQNKLEKRVTYITYLEEF